MELKNNIEDGSTSAKFTRRRLYLVTTFTIYLGNIGFGCGMNAYSPLTVDFAKKYETEVDQISIVFTVLMISYLIGALLTSFLYNFISRQLGVILFQAGIATALCLTPYCPTLVFLYAVAAVLGLCHGAYDASQVVWIMEMWQAESGPFIQAQHFFFAVGSLIPGILMAPFLNQGTSSDKEKLRTFSTVRSNENSEIWIPFTVLAIPAILAASFQLLLFIFKPYVAPKQENGLPNILNTLEDNGSQGIYPKNHRWLKHLKLKLIILSAIFCGFYQGMEISSAQFISTFAQFGEHALSESEGSLVLTALMGSYTVGRGIGIFAILKIPPQFILLFNLTIQILGNSILCITNLGVWGLWLGASLIGLGFSTVYASFCAYIERHLVFTNAVGSLMLVCGSSVGAIYPIIIGQQIKNNPIVLTYVNFFSIAAIFGAFVLILVLTFKGRPFSLKT